MTVTTEWVITQSTLSYTVDGNVGKKHHSLPISPPRHGPDALVSITTPVAHASMNIWHQEWYVLSLVPHTLLPVSLRFPEVSSSGHDRLHVTHLGRPVFFSTRHFWPPLQLTVAHVADSMETHLWINIYTYFIYLYATRTRTVAWWTWHFSHVLHVLHSSERVNIARVTYKHQQPAK